MTATAKRIVYVEGNVDGTIGGSYFSLLFLVSGLDRSRFDPIVVFATENSLIARFQERGIRTLVRPTPRPVVIAGMAGRLLGKAVNLLVGAVLEPLRLARFLRRERTALLHLNNSVARNHSWMIAARLARIPCITHERGINNREFTALERRLARRLKAVICISAAVKDNFIARGLGDLSMATIYNGLDPDEMRVTRSAAEIRAELAIPPHARLIGIVGNIKPWKGQEVVIRAMANLHEEFPDLVCLLIGDTSPDSTAYRAQILKLTQELKVADRLIITGFRSDVANYVNALEILIHASTAPEPFGRVLLEGMALEKPLVASCDGAVPEIVVDGETGLLFEPGQPDALANCLRSLLTDTPRAKRFGLSGRRRMETQFSIVHNVDQTQLLYDRLLG